MTGSRWWLWPYETIEPEPGTLYAVDGELIGRIARTWARETDGGVTEWLIEIEPVTEAMITNDGWAPRARPERA